MPPIGIATALVLMFAICIASLAMAKQARSHRIRAEASAARAIRISREQCIIQHLESSGGCARLVVDDRDVEVHVRPSGSPAQIGDQVARAIRRWRRGGS